MSHFPCLSYKVAASFFNVRVSLYPFLFEICHYAHVISDKVAPTRPRPIFISQGCKVSPHVRAWRRVCCICREGRDAPLGQGGEPLPPPSYPNPPHSYPYSPYPPYSPSPHTPTPPPRHPHSYPSSPPPPTPTPLSTPPHSLSPPPPTPQRGSLRWRPISTRRENLRSLSASHSPRGSSPSKAKE